MHQTLAANPEDAKGCANLDGPESLHIVYTSQLAPGEDYTAYGRICRVARPRNGSLAVSGVLLFDGQRFCQWLHGEPDATARLMLSIARDKRHAAVQVRLQAMLPSDAIAPGWRAGFVDSDTLDQFIQHPAIGTDQVLAALGRLLAAADIEPAMPQARPGRAWPLQPAPAAFELAVAALVATGATARRPTEHVERALHRADFGPADTGLPFNDTVRT